MKNNNIEITNLLIDNANKNDFIFGIKWKEKKYDGNHPFLYSILNINDKRNKKISFLSSIGYNNCEIIKLLMDYYLF